MSSPSGPQQPFTDNQQQFPPPAGQPGQFPPPGGDPNQGGFPPPQGGGFQPAAPQPPRRGGGWGKRIAGIVATLLVLGGIFAVTTYLNRDAASKAKVGDCVSQEGSDELKVVECGSAEADFKVVGRVEDKTQAEAGISACGPFVDQGAEQAYWEGEQGKKGLVLCLGPVG
ncbi:LppU/SCO3897 family protein [Virgisporangium ochraceum]|uniref:Uncharacterized protein n=1 Tax=Virgisporangium ochraceum TaxID=65505 RepID=A0A8J3ZRD8_9ACTN|nr:hypothetical protein [Virgisporangium ochraceum]GIJ69094.1 hypothetical protein Voc01_040110 [Virgisporangium ochraceum]